MYFKVVMFFLYVIEVSRFFLVGNFGKLFKVLFKNKELIGLNFVKSV